MQHNGIRRKLIEVALPLEAINKASAREKSIRHGHPSTLHLWWARRPLAACRAVLFAQLVDDPSAWPKRFRGEEAQRRERERLHKVIERLVPWEASNDEVVLNEARWEIARSLAWGRCEEPPPASKPDAVRQYLLDHAPPVYDPFCGGGSIPLEAQRLGLRAIASDLNPVAVMITKALVEFPPKFAGLPPVGARASSPQVTSGTLALPHKGWHSRGYLPHFDAPSVVQFITYRLADALPEEALERILEKTTEAGERRERVEQLLNAGHGACHLRDPRVARMVENALLRFDDERYRLIAWAVMPNHVHVVIETMPGHPLDRIIHSWKSFTAKQANALLGSTGAFWQTDYFDRFIRDEAHLHAVLQYVHENPVEAGLVGRAEDWPYSSATRAPYEASGTLALQGAREGARASGPSTTGETPAKWKGAQGLAEDVRWYGRWMRDEAEKRIGHLYPKARLPDGSQATVIAWLWARTVKSPNPAARGAEVPLISSFLLSTKPGKEAWVEIVPDASARDGWRFKVRTAKQHGKPPENARDGTIDRKGGRCALTGVAIPFKHIRAEGKAGRMGARLMAIVAEGRNGRIYLPPDDEHERIAASAKPSWKPDQALPNNPRNFNTPIYGLTTFGDLFTPRQLVALTTFSDLVLEARAKALEDAKAAGFSPDPTPLAEAGTGAQGYADALTTYLALATDRLADRLSSLSGWDSSRDTVRNTFGRQALPMVWDFAEGNPFSNSSGNFEAATLWVAKAVEHAPAQLPGSVAMLDAANGTRPPAASTITDPPYYDNIGYADLSDFFYVWLRRTLKDVFPREFATVLVPKERELVATPYRFRGGQQEAERFFLDGMRRAIANVHIASVGDVPTTIYYAFKQAEIETDGVVSTGWATFLEAVIDAGFEVNGTWPVRTELSNRMVGREANALSSSVVLVCRKRPTDAPSVGRAEFLRALRQELPAGLKALRPTKIMPVDMAQASIGLGMSVFSRFSEVFEADDTPVSVQSALVLINEELDAFLTEQEGLLDSHSRFAVGWFEHFGWRTARFGQAQVMAMAFATGVQAVVDSGIFYARAGEARLLKRDELDPAWDIRTDTKVTVWECCQHLIRRLEGEGEESAARLLKTLGPYGDLARDLAYRLYAVCERKRWAEEARAYNGLIIAWPHIARLAEQMQAEPVRRHEERQGQLAV